MPNFQGNNQYKNENLHKNKGKIPQKIIDFFHRNKENNCNYLQCCQNNRRKNGSFERNNPKKCKQNRKNREFCWFENTERILKNFLFFVMIGVSGDFFCKNFRKNPRKPKSKNRRQNRRKCRVNREIVDVKKNRDIGREKRDRAINPLFEIVRIWWLKWVFHIFNFCEIIEIFGFFAKIF